MNKATINQDDFRLVPRGSVTASLLDGKVSIDGHQRMRLPSSMVKENEGRGLEYVQLLLGPDESRVMLLFCGKDDAEARKVSSQYVWIARSIFETPPKPGRYDYVELCEPGDDIPYGIIVTIREAGKLGADQYSDDDNPDDNTDDPAQHPVYLDYKDGLPQSRIAKKHRMGLKSVMKRVNRGIEAEGRDD